MKHLIAYVLTWVLVTTSVSLPAVVQQSWVARCTVSATGTNQAVAMALDEDGNVIVGGHGTSTNGDLDYVAIKYLPSNVLIWVKVFSTSTNDILRGLALAKEGRVVVTGTSGTVSYNVAAALEWVSEYGGRALVCDTNGIVFVAGFLDQDFSVVKLDATGSNAWVRTYDQMGRADVAQAITLDSGGGIFVGGRVTWFCDRIGCYETFAIIKYHEDGNQSWATVFPTFGEPVHFSFSDRVVEVRGMMIDSNGNLHIAGRLPGNFGRYFYASKYSADGNVQWYGSISPAGDEGLTAMTMDRNGNMYIAGRRIRNNPNVVYQTFKVSDSGTELWSAQYLGPIPGYHKANAIALDSAGNVYVTGQSPGPGTGNDYATIKYSPDGQELWVQRYDGPAHGDDVATAIAVAPDGSVYVTGWSTTASNLIEITTIKYAQSPGLTLDTNRNAQLQFLGAPGASNRVQATTDFLDWLDLGFSIADTNGCLRFLDTNAPGYPYRFYRMVPP
jgi:uncharacterized delta-60 repeat protein